VPQAAAMLRASAPHVRLELGEAEPPESYALLRRAECDVVIAFHYDRPTAETKTADTGRSHHDVRGAAFRPTEDDTLAAGMIATPLLDEQWELLVPIGHRLVDHGRLDAGEPPAPVDLAALADERWIAGCPTCRVAFASACDRSGFTPDIVCSTDDNMALQSLVAAELGVTLVPRLVSSFLRHPRVVAIPVQPAIWRHVVAYTWADLAKVGAVRDTLNALRAVAADAGGVRRRRLRGA